MSKANDAPLMNRVRFEADLIGILGGLAKKDEQITVTQLAQRAIEIIDALKGETEQLKRELAISMRACGNWREFPDAPNAELEKDWQFALRAIAENREIEAETAAMLETIKALEEKVRSLETLGAKQ